MPNDRIIDLGPIPSPDTSGVGQMLFENLQAEQASQRKLKEAGAIAEIESKYNRESQEHANKLQQGIEVLRNNMAIARSQQEYQRAQVEKQQGAKLLEGMIQSSAQAGVPMPGLTMTDIGTPEAGGMPGPTVSTRPIEPGAVDIARSTFAQNLAHAADARAKREGLSYELQKKSLLDQLDLINDDDARQAVDLANRFDAMDDHKTAEMIRGMYGVTGRGSRTSWQKFQESALPRLVIANSNNVTRMAIAREVTARQQQIAKLKLDVSKALQTQKLDNAQYNNLKSLFQATSSQLNGLRGMHNQLMLKSYDQDPEQLTKTQAQMRQIEIQMEELIQVENSLRDRMAQWQPSGPATVNPGPVAPGLQGPTQNDPLGIRRGK